MNKTLMSSLIQSVVLMMVGLFCSQAYADGIGLGTTAVSVLCTQPTAGKPSLVVREQLCSSFLGSVNCEDPPKINTGQQQTPCEAAQASVNELIINACVGNGSVLADIIANLGNFKTPTTSLVLPNGNILQQWNFFCYPPAG